MFPFKGLHEQPAAVNKKIFVASAVALLLGFVSTPTVATAVEKPTDRNPSSVLGKTGDGPISVVVDPFGGVYTANSRANNVTKITASGVSSVFGTTGKTPMGIALDSEGNVYTSTIGDNTVTKI